MGQRNIFEGAVRLEQMYFSPIRRVGERAAEIQEEGKDVIFFSAGEPDFNMPARIKEQTIAAIHQNQTHYAPNRGLLKLREESWWISR